MTSALTCVRLGSIDVHNSDRQCDPTGLTFAALTPLAALFEVILGVLTPLGHNFWAQVAPTWAPGPSLTLEKQLFSRCFFIHFKKLQLLLWSRPKDLKMTVLTPPAALFEIILAVLTPPGHDFWAQVAPTWAPGPSLTLEKQCFS